MWPSCKHLISFIGFKAPYILGAVPGIAVQYQAQLLQNVQLCVRKTTEGMQHGRHQWVVVKIADFVVDLLQLQ